MKTINLKRICGLLLTASLQCVAPVYAAAPKSGPSTPAGIAFECKEKASRKELEDTLDRVQSGYQKLSSVSAKFDQDSYLDALHASESSSGSVIFSKPGKMKWTYDEPEPQIFVLKDRTVWLYQPEIKQVMIDEMGQVLLTDLPVSFLMGVGNLHDGFNLKDGCKSSLGTVLVLDPKDATAKGKENSLKGFKLLVSPQGLPAGAQVFDVVGNVTTIALKELKSNPAISDAEFTINYPPGTDVNDRRKQPEGRK